MASESRKFGVPKLRMNFVRGLRFRLAVSYVAFFALLLVVILFVFNQKLKVELDSDDRAALDESFSVAKSYVRIENLFPVWMFDATDPDESFVVERVRHVYMLADSEGNVLQNSTVYKEIGLDSRDEVKRILALRAPEVRARLGRDGTPYLIKAGAETDSAGNRYFLAVGRSIEGSRQTLTRFRQQSYLYAPLLLVLAGVLSWWLAGRAIQPVNQLAGAVQKLSGSNLSLQIPQRGANDELDYLIESFNRMTERLHQSFEQVRRFSTDVSHELRTPLTAIRGQLEVALFTAKTPEQYHEAMINALEDVEKLSSIVRALLLLSQAESGQLVLQKTPLDLTEAARDVVDQFQIPAEENRISLTAQLGREVTVLADRIQIERLLSNLLSNAAKYTPAGGTIRVIVDVDPAHPGWARLVVEDSGVGIPEENLPHIFDRFYRVRGPQTNPIHGLGLGLSFVAWIVQAHDGRIEVASTPGRGSRFTVFLPLASQPTDQPAPQITTVQQT
jgi:heavy metal sensor kinase